MLEIIATSVEDAVNAEKGGAGRLEIVRDLSQDGLTPDLELVKQIYETVNLPVRVMIRPRDSFTGFSQHEIEQMRAQVKLLSGIGIDGIVIGFLTPEGEPDEARLKYVLGPQKKIGVTFHRAFDQVTDPIRAMRQFTSHGLVDRVLTSGLASSAMQGWKRLAALRGLQNKHLKIIAAGGINADNIALLARRTGIKEFHVGRGCRIPPTEAGIVNVEKVRNIVRALESLDID
ncbi:MAG: hypothetical protein D6814_04045 [Calditrichaeota bacterium]|nr:MAG: hypothetical protein D6814_04045 [Calditrichota bacterium]